MNLTLFIRAVVILAPVAIAQRCEVAQYVSYAKLRHADTSPEAQQRPARAAASVACGSGEQAGCASFLELTAGRDPG